MNSTYKPQGYTSVSPYLIVDGLLNESGSSSKERLFESMRPFVDAAGLDEILSRLSQRGWIERGPVSGSGTSEFQLTAEGRRQHTVILATQKEAREKARRGVS